MTRKRLWSHRHLPSSSLAFSSRLAGYAAIHSSSPHLLSESLVLRSPTCLPGRHFQYLVSAPSLHIGSDGKESACDAGDLGLIPGLGGSPAEGNGNPFQYFCLENAMDRGAWRATVHGVAKSWTQLSEFHFFFFHTIKYEKFNSVWKVEKVEFLPVRKAYR